MKQIRQETSKLIVVPYCLTFHLHQKLLYLSRKQCRQNQSFTASKQEGLRLCPLNVLKHSSHFAMGLQVQLPTSAIVAHQAPISKKHNASPTASRSVQYRKRAGGATSDWKFET